MALINFPTWKDGFQEDKWDWNCYIFQNSRAWDDIRRTLNMSTWACALVFYQLWTLSNLPLGEATCFDGQFCHYNGMEGKSTRTLEFPRYNGLIRQSCPYLCQKELQCAAVTFDSERDCCRLHLERDGDSCISLTSTPGKMIWILKKWDFCPNVCLWSNWCFE